MTAKSDEAKTSTQPQHIEKILRKTDSTTYEIIERTPQTAFTTSPKTLRRRNKTNICRERAERIVASFYPEREVGYNAVKVTMKVEFGLCSDKTILSYLGRPETKKKSTMHQTVRYVRTATTVMKDHTFRVTLPRVKGYLELFGLASMFEKDGVTWFRLHYNFQESFRPFLNKESYSSTGTSGDVSKQVFSFSSNSITQDVDAPGKTGDKRVYSREERES